MKLRIKSIYNHKAQQMDSSEKEMDEKIKLYLNQGAKEVWLCGQQGEISYYAAAGRLNESALVDKK